MPTPAKARLQQAIVQMRTRMQEASQRRSGKESFDLKKDPGMIDIEFIVQYVVLLNAADNPELIKSLDISHLCQALADSGQLGVEKAAQLSGAYEAYLGRNHLQALEDLPAVVPAKEFNEMRAQVMNIWESLLLLRAKAVPWLYKVILLLFGVKILCTDL